ncbi:hypothetical protein GCM10009664_19150 [Kitasatospora gansuensis]
MPTRPGTPPIASPWYETAATPCSVTASRSGPLGSGVGTVTQEIDIPARYPRPPTADRRIPDFRRAGNAPRVGPGAPPERPVSRKGEITP